ncbi:RBP11-like subunits of RNA polymerase [Gloeophyllum trabeum ATCC 11539]|uniref:RBP11-like subunits of RNA polymerase n=1 Tax=Gloeophyllum trabeum (strain ATCC 11539 / FP-39264 / Madison 617) TaxID=670483 RepID=S7PWV8_GLOTA|nr:RBP11-like subunits of RNA polymerase [Gloeophyllum trabeum ATCC 11539]EPQ52101.1 RBP11-like subunits of RNA polymerase [Gloeophyllum trabeum ATCC 11539]
MNAPNRSELFVLEDGEKAVEIIEDTKIPNAATIKVVKQDHTLANMLRSQLLATPSVLFAGYKVPHPLQPYFILKIQTDGTITPADVLQQACSKLIGTLTALEAKFKREFSFKDVEGAVVSEDPYGGPSTGGPTWAGGRDYLDF